MYKIVVLLVTKISYCKCDLFTQYVSNSYTMGCPHVRGDNIRALATELSYVQVGKHGITIF